MMAPKRKRSDINEQSTKIKSSNRKEMPLSGSIVDCFRKQQQQKTKTVNCPICDGLVFYNEINVHLDSGCIYYGDQDERKNGGLTCKQDCTHEDVSITSRSLYDDKVKSDHGTLGNSKSPIKTVNSESTQVAMNEPYYFHNFLFVLNAVLSQEDDKRLLNDSDNLVVKCFYEMSDNAKMLYVRLYQRKYKWFQENKIKYPGISEKLQPFFNELIKTGLLQTQAKLDNLDEILNLLPANDVQELAKAMHIVTKGKNKKQIVNTLLQQSKTQSSLFSNNGNRTQKEIIKKAKSLLGSCVKLDAATRNVFSRIVLLFTLNLIRDDDDNYGAKLSFLFLSNIGKVSFPDYEVSRSSAIFPDRDAVVNYDLANQDLYLMEDFIEHKDFDEARKIFAKIHPRFSDMLKKLVVKDACVAHAMKLPVHLRCFTESWILTKMSSRGVDLLQRNKEYCKAVELLRQLLSQTEFCPNSRGWWWERLALNLDQHLKKPSEALDAVRHGLADTMVKTGHRLALEQRARRICDMKRNSSLKKYLNEIKFTELRQPKVVTISGKRLENEPIFMLKEVNTDGIVNNVSFCSVEEMALDYYKQQEYNEGIHGESLTFSTIFTLLVWDIIFSNIGQDVFRTPFQTAPLDIYCENFYWNRKEIIDTRLEEIRSATVEQLTEKIESTWLEQEGRTCVGVNWNIFTGVKQVMEVARCLGCEIVAGICKRFATNYRHTRSGMPDLFVWNSQTFQYKIVEVKGPNDKLSTKQQVWLDVLVSLGCETEVLYVKAVGGRKL